MSPPAGRRGSTSTCTCRGAGWMTCRAGTGPGFRMIWSSLRSPSWRCGSWNDRWAAGLPATWVAFDEVYGRSKQLRVKASRAGLAYVAIVPCDYPVTTPAGTTIRADAAIASAVFERRSCGKGSKGPRYNDWAMTPTGIDGQYLLIRRLISRPDQYTFYLCWAPPGRPATMTYFITIAWRRWPVEETFKTGKDVLGWDQSQTHTFNGICRHTALAALAQLRAAAIRGTLTGSIQLPNPDSDSVPASHTTSDGLLSDADLRIPLGDAPTPDHGGKPCPPGIAAIKLSIAETARLAHLATQYTTGLISRARLAFALRWSRRRRPTRPPPTGTTTTPGSSPQPYPDSQPQP